MLSVDVEKQQQEAEFARKATEHFLANANHYTYADGDPKPGQLFAIRWNSFAIIVVRLDDEAPVLNYAAYQFIQQDFPKLTPSHP
jgi:hypothetical protein